MFDALIKKPIVFKKLNENYKEISESGRKINA